MGIYPQQSNLKVILKTWVGVWSCELQITFFFSCFFVHHVLPRSSCTSVSWDVLMAQAIQGNAVSRENMEWFNKKRGSSEWRNCGKCQIVESACSNNKYRQYSRAFFGMSAPRMMTYMRYITPFIHPEVRNYSTCSVSPRVIFLPF